MKQAEEFVAAAMSMVGTPFGHQGRLPGHLLDCVGLAVCAARAVGFGLRDFTAYRSKPQRGVLMQAFREQADPVEPGDERAGDLVAVAVRRRVASDPHHVSILRGDGWIIHADAAVGRVVAVPYGPPWTEWTDSIWRLRWLR